MRTSACRTRSVCSRCASIWWCSCCSGRHAKAVHRDVPALAPAAVLGAPSSDDLLHPPVASSAVLLGPACGAAQNLTRGSLSLAVRARGTRLSTCTQRADMHGSSEAITLAARTPAQVALSPRGYRDSRGEGQQADRPAPASPPNPAPSRRGGRGPAEVPGSHSRPPGPILPSLCGPDGARAPRGDHPAGVTTGFDRLSQRLR